jgi:predicted nucleotidyltransferase
MMTGAWGRIKGRGRLEVMTEEKLTALKRYFEDHPDLGVASAYLFGSHAEGRDHRESDVDVGVLLQKDRYPTPRDRFDMRVLLSSELISVVHCNEVDVVILNDAPPLLGRKIVYDGIRLFLGDPKADYDYGRDVQILAADLEPWLQRLRKLRLEALAR